MSAAVARGAAARAEEARGVEMVAAAKEVAAMVAGRGISLGPSTSVYDDNPPPTICLS